jgi:hypothetical protein
MLYEVETTFRQIFTDGRALPKEVASPSWQGMSVGRWQGDTLVVESSGFNDASWLDARGTPHSTEMRVEERFRRRDYGHLELTITVTESADVHEADHVQRRGRADARHRSARALLSRERAGRQRMPDDGLCWRSWSVLAVRLVSAAWPDWD